MPLLNVASKDAPDCDPRHEHIYIGSYCGVLQKGTVHIPLREV